ncbi:hypothetical protein IU414_18135 [Nocardia farcinica]|uniref:hypothetical protein n=1 Tax=Nocardia farcinica TaxID=37329 RepID=UPI001894519C|nr:hypothetical protein [Nocardia farcinica]MBF6253951.1 hypothetical protein [Nocardia farcinica]MBF6265488.1 hypothetical protein [Nocardia farcinica]MBF6271103.1 hypothetical protein [Nocardia farcinica]MBF6284088.1 hypothetical protein [Nocardia farcinica]MBF6308121.1 hypothetical protein [Nocardia farcinica]
MNEPPERVSSERHLAAVNGPLVPSALSIEQRRERLDERIAWLRDRTNCTVHLRGDLRAVVVLWGPRPAHGLHAALSVATAGLWAPMWLAITWQRRPLRLQLEVDDAGVVRATPIKR